MFAISSSLVGNPHSRLDLFVRIVPVLICLFLHLADADCVWHGMVQYLLEQCTPQNDPHKFHCSSGKCLILKDFRPGSSGSACTELNRIHAAVTVWKLYWNEPGITVL